MTLDLLMLRAVLVGQLAFVVACGQHPPARDSTARDSTAVSAPASSVIPLANGINAVDLLGNGTKAQVFVSWRGNYNAHGSSSVAFYLFAHSDLGDSTGVWQILPFFGGPNDGDSGRETFHTSEGADCILGDLRVLRNTNAPVTIVVASRELRASYADSAAVRFDYYRVARNSGEIVGWPPFYFEHFRSMPAKRWYCDVNEAFERELGLGTSGVGHADGGR